LGRRMHTPPPFHCHGPGCGSTDLIKAHIVPQWVGRFIDSPHGANVVITPTYRRQNLPHGIFDPRILCAKCDGYLNTHYDDPAREIFLCELSSVDMNMCQRRFTTKRAIDCDTLCRFFLSVLWRASISTRSECCINLGNYEDVVRDVLFHVKSISTLFGFGVVIFRYISKIDVSRLYTLPVTLPMSCLGHNAFVFQFAGFQINVKLDPFPFPPELQQDVLNGRNVLRGYVTDFESSLLGRKDRKMVLDAARRRNTP
jgi:hypothetical protein